MYCKTINYVDYNGNQRTESFWFHMTKPKLAKMFAKFYPEAVKQQNATAAEYENIIAKIVENKEPNELIDMFEYLILNSYGIKSEDGTSFEQSEELSNKFSNTAAYATIFSEFFNDSNEMMNFFKHITPQDVSEAIDKKFPGMMPATQQNVVPIQSMPMQATPMPFMNPGAPVQQVPMETWGGAMVHADINNTGN